MRTVELYHIRPKSASKDQGKWEPNGLRETLLEMRSIQTSRISSLTLKVKEIGGMDTTPIHTKNK